MTNGMKEYQARRDSGEDISIIGMYSEFGTELGYPPGTGPFFTPAVTDTIDDISSNKVFVPIYTITKTTDNTTNIVCLINDEDNKVHYGYNLIAKVGNKEILIARTAGVGKLKTPNVKIGVFWEITYT